MKRIKDKMMLICILLQSIAYIIDSTGTQNRMLITIYIIFMLIAGSYWILFGFENIKKLLNEIQKNNFSFHKLIKITAYILIIVLGILIVFTIFRNIK